MFYEQKKLNLFSVYMSVYVYLSVVITNGHKNEKCENWESDQKKKQIITPCGNRTVKVNKMKHCP